MIVYEIPLTPAPQRFSISLAGTFYRLAILWRDNAQGGWVLDIATQDGTPIIGGIPLVTGCDLLAQYKYLGLGGALVVQTDHDPDAVPTFANLGVQGRLYFVPDVQ